MLTTRPPEALETLERQRLFASFNNGYRRLSEDPEAWTVIEAERVVDAGTLADCSS